MAPDITSQYPCHYTTATSNYHLTIQESLFPRYLFATLHPPGRIPVMEKVFDWKTTSETRWTYGNIASPTKIFTLSRLGGPISMINWQLKRNNLRLASYSSDAEGSLRLLCEQCSKFQVMNPRADPQIGLQGCSMCISKTVFIDTTALVSNYPILTSKLT